MKSVPSRRPSEANPTRLGALAKLPVFYALEGKRVVVAGGTPAAAWKAELLAAAGGLVDIYAVTASDELEALLQRGAAAGKLRRHLHPWHLGVFENATLALADAEDDAEAKAFWCAARQAGVPVNVIDRPAFCQFQFGSIVNRSPVVIGISTDGAAPILGQAIRRRIETLIPAYLAGWGKVARTVRSTVMTRLEAGPLRRRFWEHVTDVAFRRPPSEDEAHRLLAKVDEVQRDGSTSTIGQVTLVGAGPGDAELLTLKAVRALQAADVILFDDLISEDVLELARREAKRMMVGKRGGRDSCRQDDINDLMVKLAKQGKNVVRLKSGDPMVFGRAGEEITRLEQEGVFVSVVPGITTASALAATLKRSMTHRDRAQSVRFVTGHSKAGKLPEHLDWSGLANSETTLMVYMGGRTASALAQRLIDEGRSPSTPVVIGHAVSRPDQDILSTTLGEIRYQSVCESRPVLLAIGEVFDDWAKRHNTAACQRAAKA